MMQRRNFLKINPLLEKAGLYERPEVHSADTAPLMNFYAN